MKHLPVRLLFVLILAVNPACASWFMRGEPPEVIVTNITPMETTAFEQRMRVDLRISNPNDFDLHVTGMDFKLDVKESGWPAA